MSVQTSGGATGTVEQYRMPDAGEGLTEAEIVTWRVAVGDTVDVNDVVVEVETAKSLVELPCPFAGEVVELLAAEGETVAVGAPILAVRTGGGDGGGAGAGGPAPGSASDGAEPGAEPDGSEPEGSGTDGPVADGSVADGSGADGSGADGDVPTGGEPAGEVAQGAPGADAPAPPPGGEPVGPSAQTAAHPSTQAAAGAGRQAVLVGYGPAAGATRRRARRAGPGAASPRPPARAEGGEEPLEEVAATAAGPVLAKPPVRKLAKDLGVDLRALRPSGEGGVVTRDDVLAASRADRQHAASGTTAVTTPDRADAPDAPVAAGADGTVRTPVKGVRKRTAEAMVASAFTAPHVTEWVEVDVTASVELLVRLRADRATRDLRLSPFTLVARAMVLAARRHPEVNASWDEAAQEIVQHPHVGLGFAAATDRGLVVPVVRDADSLDLAGLARAIGELVDTARAGTIQPAQMSGGTLTVTNVGVFGVDGGTPILPPGTGLILACGQVRRKPWVVGAGEDERVVPRDVMTLAASFDHRFVDGELGSRYLAAVARLVSDPAQALVWG
ncbi:dihydrolipoamide acetyltransferase family protein [Aquipuribacter sp. SD81]|uniref:dihydrolipoamide acetyltransferase family protein n=1 Tax=Aquipuribacter sp. SD81 TaxID=3127703 RepID=UPI003015A5FC